MKSKIKFLVFVLLLIIVPPLLVKASSSGQDSTVYVSADEVVNGNLFAIGKNILVDGSVSGDLITIAGNLTVNGKIDGDIIALSQNIDISGDVAGNVRVVGSNVSINSTVGRNLNIFGYQVQLGEKSKVTWDALIAGVSTNIKGDILGNLNLSSQDVIFAPLVGGNLNLKLYNDRSGSFVLDRSAKIEGNLDYQYRKNFEIQNDGQIIGEVNGSEFMAYTKGASYWWWKRLFSILSLLFIGLIMITVIPKFNSKVLTSANKKPLPSLLWGLLSFLIIPPLTILSALTIIGLPLALILLSFWLSFIFIAKVFTAIIAGDFILKKIIKVNYHNQFWPLFCGIIITSFLISVPKLSWLINLAIISLGWGAALIYVTNKSKNI